VAAPANDDFANAEVITGGSGSTSGTNVDATPDYPPDEQIFGEGNVWYAWTCPAGGKATFTLTGALVDTDHTDPIITVYDGPDFAGLRYRVFNSSFGGSSPLSVNLAVAAGVTYYIEVDYYTVDTSGNTFTLTWASVPATAKPTKPQLTLLISTSTDILLTAAPAVGTYPDEGVYKFELWQGIAPLAEAFVTDLATGGFDGTAVYDDSSPTYPVYYRIKAVNSVGATWSDELYLVGPRDEVIVVGTVGEETDVTGSGTLDVVLTDDVPASGPEVASWLIVVTFTNRDPANPPESMIVQPTVTDDAPVVGPYYSPNVLVGGQWGFDNMANMNFATYLILNPLHAGDTVTLIADHSVTWMSARLHAVTGLAYPDPDGPSDPTVPNPPYDATHHRPGFEAIDNSSSFDIPPEARWFSDFVFFMGRSGYASIPPSKSFASGAFPETYTVPEQFSVEVPRSVGFVHQFYAFDTIPDFTQQSMPHFHYTPGDVSGGGIGYGTYQRGPGPPIPVSLHANQRV
jgi:hypothetical protein